MNNLMPEKHRRLLFIGCLAATAWPLLPDARGAETIHIIFSVPNMAFPWNAAAARIAQAEGKKLGAEVTLQDAQLSSPKQSSDLRNAIVQKVNGVVLGAVDVNALVPAVNEVIDADIPIVTVDRGVQGTKKPVPHFGLDNVTGGSYMAKYAIERHPDGAKIILLTGQPGSSPAIDRAKGIHDAVKAAGDKYQIVAEQTGNWARAQGLSVTQNILTSLDYTPDVILGSNDDMALGAIQAIQQVGISPKKIMVIGFDCTPDGLRSIRDGQLTASVEYPLKQVTIAVDALIAYLRDKTPLQGKILAPTLIDEGNLATAERWNEVK